MATSGELLAELRKDKGWTQKRLAEEIGVVRTTISSYENNTYLPETNKLILLADIFDVSVDYLLGRSRSELKTNVFDQEFIKVKDKSIPLGTIIKKQINLSKRSKTDLTEIIEFLEYRDKTEK